MGDRISISISGDTGLSDKTLNRGPLALFLGRQYKSEDIDFKPTPLEKCQWSFWYDQRVRFPLSIADLGLKKINK